MGFRFRKSIGKGPFRINISKSGIGYSVGSKGIRYTKKAGGGTRTTVSVPGTGISYVKDSRATKTTASRSNTVSKEENRALNNPEMLYCPHCQKLIPADSACCPFCKKPHSSSTGKRKISCLGCITYPAITLVVLALIGMLTGGSEPNEPAPVDSTPTTFPIATTLPEESTTTAIPETTVAPEESAPTTVPETTAASTEPPETKTPSFDVNDTVQYTPAPSNETTYIVNNHTKKFHYSTCSSTKQISDANRGTITGTREDLISNGYSPCGRCDP